jgi:protein-S-isoprenylcysteine O-methyltransferase Ste14
VASFETAHMARFAAQRAAYYGVIACWCIFMVEFLARKLAPQTRESRRDQTAILGMALQAIGYFMVWVEPVPRAHFSPVMPGSSAVEWGLAVLAVAMAAVSTWLVDAASRRLGKQWALAARLVEGHTLIRDGPYCFVRNPIYLGMFGMLLATGIVRTPGVQLLVASLLFVAGTYIRIRSEERLLRAAFGGEFEAYARNVPALIPGVY